MLNVAYKHKKNTYSVNYFYYMDLRKHRTPLVMSGPGATALKTETRLDFDRNIRLHNKLLSSNTRERRTCPYHYRDHDLR